MLKPDAATKLIEEWWLADDDEELVVDHLGSGFKKAPAKLKKIGYAIFGGNAEGVEEYHDEAEAFEEQQRRVFARLTSTERKKLLALLFGKLAGDVEFALKWIVDPQRYSEEDSLFLSRPVKSQIPEVQFNYLQSIRNLTYLNPPELSIEWLAAWIGHLQANWRLYGHKVYQLLASAIDRGGKSGKQVLKILLDSGNKDHEVGIPGMHVNSTLLMAKDPAGWDFVERLLLAAKRQEGLRQSVMDSLVMGHPDAFRRFFRLIVNENLTRYSSVLMKINEWLGVEWEAREARKVNPVISHVADMLENEKLALKEATQATDPQTAYFALWALASHDTEKCIAAAAKRLKQDMPEFRFATLKLLSLLDDSHEKATQLRIESVADEDLRIVFAALFGVDSKHCYSPELTIRNPKQAANLMKVIVSRLESLPRKAKKQPPLVWDWSDAKIAQSDVADVLVSTVRYPGSTESPDKIAKWIPFMSSTGRYSAIYQITQQDKMDKRTRPLLFELAGDKVTDNAELVLGAIANLKLTEAESQILEGYLSRTSTTYRQEVMKVLLKQQDTILFAALERLLRDGQKPRRAAGVELLRQAAESGRDPDRCIALAESYRESRKKLTKEESLQIEAILKIQEATVGFEDCLGLIDPADRTPVKAPRDRGVMGYTTAAGNLLQELKKFIKANRKTEITYRKYHREEVTEPLGQIEWGFPSPELDKPIRDQLSSMPQFSMFQEWYRGLPAKCRDKDGFDLLRALVHLEIVDDWEFDEFKTYLKDPARKGVAKFLGVDQKTKQTDGSIVSDILGWLVRTEIKSGVTSFCLDAAETLLTRIPELDLKKLASPPRQIKDQWGDLEDDPFHDFRQLVPLMVWLETAKRYKKAERKPPKNLSVRLWDLEHWIDEPVPGASRKRPDNDVLMEAYENKKANLADFYDHLVGPPNAEYGGYDLRFLSGRSFPKSFRDFMERKEIRGALKKIQSKLLEVELNRGEAKSISSELALHFQCYRGITPLRDLMAALGKKGFKQSVSWQLSTEDNREATFTAMISHTFPDESDTVADFSQMVRKEIKAGTWTEERMLQLAFLAPQWSAWIGHALKWDGFDEAIYWFIAHLKYAWGIDEAFQTDEDLDEENDRFEADDDDEDQPERLTRWERIIRERTHLTRDERDEGAIDVSWFHRVYQRLSPKRWEALSLAARYAANSAQAKRAKMIGDVLLGKVAKQDLVDGIRKKNLKENVRLLGLLPLASGNKRDADLSDRYEVLESYRAYANKLSSMSRPEALRAHEIGMQNLASTAGYEDPMRLQWSLEAESTSDLAAGPLEAKKGDVRLTLELDSDATPVTTVYRGDKVLKSVPKTVAKEKKFVALRDRAKHLKKQASRIKSSLELAMCRQDSFTGAELNQLSSHAVLWPQLQRLVLSNGTQMGYPAKRGKALKDHSGKETKVSKNDSLQIAHPIDFLKSKEWPKWQRECFNIERLQPFKQVFRELYVLSAEEKKEKFVSRRYAGHQVNRKQAFALWGRRGWSIDEYENVWKSIHHANLNVSVGFESGFTTPLEVEGLTLETVEFHTRNDRKPVPLAKVPPTIFSEVMRDLDLVVSVAHVGEVDPEISASTVELRRVLLAETCQLLGLNNVKLKAKSNHVTIQGEIADYSVHLGSGVVHKLPGGSVCLVPVHSQHRGRLFLPFADNDPKTAEVLSKTILLARDQEIDDPILLQQLRAG